MFSNRMTLLAALAVLSAAAACQPTEAQRRRPNVDYKEIARDYALVAPTDIAIVPVEGVAALDPDMKRAMRQNLYELLMMKGYAPVALDYVDDVLARRGLLDAAISTRHAWNVAPYKGLFFCDGLLMVSIESFRDPGRPETEGVEIWGKAALFDARTAELLYENYVRRQLIVSDPGSKEKYVAQVLADFARELLAHLPDKPDRPPFAGEGSGGP